MYPDVSAMYRECILMYPHANINSDLKMFFVFTLDAYLFKYQGFCFLTFTKQL